MSPSRANNYIYLNQNMTLFTQLSRIYIYTYMVYTYTCLCVTGIFSICT